MALTATYLYCIVHAPKAPSLARAPGGVPGAGPLVARVVRGSLWVIAADVPLSQYGADILDSSLRDLQWVARRAVAHEDVVEHFARQRESTVVPAQLFTMFSTPERAIDETRSRSREIAAVVKRIAGCQEWGVRITTRVPPVVRPTRARPPESGAAFLAAKKGTRDAAAAARLTAADAAQGVYEALADIAREARRRGDPPRDATAPPLLDAAFLVPAGLRSRFKAVVRRLAVNSATAGTDLTVTGPWPPYNFVRPEARR